MTILEKYNKSSKDKATKILNGAVARLEGMETTYSACFPYSTLADAAADFEKLNVEIESNKPVVKAVSVTMDEISSVSQGVFKSFFFHVEVTSGS